MSSTAKREELHQIKDRIEDDKTPKVAYTFLEQQGIEFIRQIGRF